MSTLIGTRRALLGSREKALDFDPGLVTFTAGMAKRTAPGPFAAAPIVQGKWDGTGGVRDRITAPRGSQVASEWYGNFDPYQGGGFVVWTPEHSTNDAGAYWYIWRQNSLWFLMYRVATDYYWLMLGGQSINIPATITAGTPEYLAWGFDTKNKLDGTNYAYFSRNDAQTFGITTAPTASTPNATIAVGSDGTEYASDGIVEGLVFTRAIPWTGSYGHNIWGGVDIVAAHAASADVALSIGSWDTTLSVPTNSTTGALVTGTGEAWSMCHSSNLL